MPETIHKIASVNEHFHQHFSVKVSEKKNNAFGGVTFVIRTINFVYDLLSNLISALFGLVQCGINSLADEAKGPYHPKGVGEPVRSR